MLLKEYLLNVLQLELSLQDQTQAISNAETALDTITPRLPSEPKEPDWIYAPQRREAKLKKPVPPQPSKDIAAFFGHLLIALLTLAYAVWTIALVVGLFSTFGKEEWNVLYVFYLTIATPLSVILFVLQLRALFDCVPNFNVKSVKERYLEEVRAYEEEQAKIEKEFNAALTQYKKDKEKQEKNYKKAMEEYEHSVEQIYLTSYDNKETAKDAISKMKTEKEATAAVLNQFYEVDIVHPKYRNISALTLIFEYLDTGRCTALAGPNGAYNIYEMELRQDQIIDKLDTVISKLEKIEQNQALMLKQLQQIRYNSDAMTEHMKELLLSNQRVEMNTKITAYCSAISAVNTAATAYFTGQIAKNTQDLKYIALGK